MDTVDYSKHIHWIRRPAPHERTKPADVFFVYPTVYVHPDRKRHHLMPMENPVFRTAARESTWWHDRIFAETCNIFAPYYRQVGMEALWMPRAEFDALSRTPYEDIRDAFLHYLTYCNNGRPFFLAGHSQGSEILIRLMCRQFGELAEASRLVAAYLIGYSVTHEDLARYPHLRVAQRRDDTGVIVSYNTSAQGLKLMPVVLPGAVAINPLNWKTDDTYAPKSMNRGSVLFEAGNLAIEKEHFTGAYLDTKTGVVMIDREAVDEMLRLPAVSASIAHHQSLHSFDIALFQRNLAENIKDRLQVFLERNDTR